MNCESCTHELVCKYKDEYTRVKYKSEMEFKGVFDIACNEYKQSKEHKGLDYGDSTSEEKAQRILENILDGIRGE